MTENHDIKFGILAVNLTTGEKFSEVDLKRTTSHETEESGCISCQKNCRCKFFNFICDFYKQKWLRVSNFNFLNTFKILITLLN